MAVSWPEIAAHRERLVRVARRRVATREDAEDVVHEAMLRCATFEELDEARLGQFLTAVTMRLCADVHRSSERAARAFRRLGYDDVPSPEEAACAAAEVDELRALLATLPDKQRDVLVDRASGMSVSQISSRHALTYKATESALSRARSTMRLALAAGLSFLGALAATVRRRPSVALAAPLTALAFVTVVHTPYQGSEAPPVVRLQPPVARTRPVSTAGATAPATAGAAAGSARQVVRIASDGDKGHGGDEYRSRKVAGVHVPGAPGGEVTADNTHGLTNHPEECLAYGTIVTITIDPSSGKPPVDERCQQPPR